MEKRRSSIMKPKKERNAFAEVDFSSTAQNTDSDRVSKKVRFSSNFVKPFSAENDNNTVWDNTYEEVINNMTESSQESNMGISQPIKDITNVNKDSAVDKVTSIAINTQSTTNVVIAGLSGNKVVKSYENMDSTNKNPTNFNLNKSLINQDDFDLTSNSSIEFTLGKGNVIIPVIKSKSKSGKRESNRKKKSLSQQVSTIPDDLQNKAIVLNPIDPGANIDLTKMDISKGNKDVETFSVERNVQGNTESSSRKTILFNPVQDDGNMEISANPSNLELKTSLFQKDENNVTVKEGPQNKIINTKASSRKTVLFNPMVDDAIMEITANVSNSNTKTFLLFQKAENNLTVKQGPQNKIINTVASSRKTILFNPMEDDANMEMSAIASNLEPKTSLIQKDENNVTAKQGPQNKILNSKESSRKTILFNHMEDDANMEMSAIASNLEPKTSLIQKDENNVTAKQGPQNKILNSKESSRKTILFNHMEDDANMEMSDNASNLELKTSLIQKDENNVTAKQGPQNKIINTKASSRKTILFNPMEDDANMEMSAIASNLEPKISLTQKDENNMTAKQGPQNKIINTKASSRKTILFNPMEDDANMEMSAIASNLEPKTSFIQKDEDNVTAKQGPQSKIINTKESSRKTILFNHIEDDANMEMSDNASNLEPKTSLIQKDENNVTAKQGPLNKIINTKASSRKTILFNPMEDDANMEITANASNFQPKTFLLFQKDENNLTVKQGPPNKITNTEASSSKAILFTPMEDDANIEISANASNLQPKKVDKQFLKEITVDISKLQQNKFETQSQRTIVANSTNKDANMDTSMKNENSSLNELLKQKTCNQLKPVENLVTSIMDLDKSEPITPDVMQAPRQNSQFFSGNKTMTSTTMDFNFENHKIFHSTGLNFGDKTESNESYQKEQVSIKEDIVAVVQNENEEQIYNKKSKLIYQDEDDSVMEKEEKIVSPFNLECRNEISTKIFDRNADVDSNLCQELLASVTRNLTKGNSSSVSDVTEFEFAGLPRSFNKMQTVDGPSSDDTQHLINYKLKNSKFQKSDFSQIISGEMAVNNQNLSPLSFSDNLSYNFSDTGGNNIVQQECLANINQTPKTDVDKQNLKSIEKVAVEFKDDKLVNEIITNTSEEEGHGLMHAICRDQTIKNISDESMENIDSEEMENTSEASSIDPRSLNPKEFLQYIVRNSESLKNDPEIQKLGDDLLRRENKPDSLEETKQFLREQNEFMDNFNKELQIILSNPKKTDIKSLIPEEKPKSLQEKVERYIKKYDTISSLKFSTSKDCVFETLYGTMSIKISMNICGVVLSINPEAIICKEKSEPSAMLINSLLLEKLQLGVIESSVGTPFTIYTLLDYIDTTMCEFEKLDDEFSDLEDRGLDMDYDYRVTLMIVDMHLFISWRIYIDFSNCQITEDGVSCEAVIGNINESEIKSLMPAQRKRGLQALIDYVHNIFNFVKKKRLLLGK